MNLNEISSDLYFLGCSIKKIEVENDIINLTNDYNRNFEFDMTVEYTEERADSFYGKVLMAFGIEINPIEDSELTHNCKIFIEMEGAFTSLNKDDQQSFVNSLYINGGSILFSIMRGKLEAMSALIFADGKLTLPLINIIAFLDEKFPDDNIDGKENK